MALEMQKIYEKDSARLKKQKTGRASRSDSNCDDPSDPNEKCIVSNFGNWTKCSQTCDQGVQFRFRDFTHSEPN